MAVGESPDQRSGSGPPDKQWPGWIGYPSAVLLVAAVTALLLLIDRFFPLGQFPIPYVVVIMLVAYVFGAGPAILAFILGLLAFVYFFVPPLHTLLVVLPSGWAGIAAYLIGTSVVGFATVMIREAKRRAESIARDLRDSEERFRLLVSGVEDYAIFSVDLEGRISSWNEGAERIKGYTAEEAIGRPISIFYTQKDIRAAKPGLALESARTEGRYEEQALRVRKDGSTFWAEVNTTPIYDDAGELCGYAKVTRDITARVEAERALQESNEELQVQTEELQVQTEELQVQTEELQVQTEELRVQAEELQTTADELNRSNESLTTEAAERKRAVDALGESESYFRAVFDSTTEAIIVMDDKGVYLHPNAATSDMLGIPAHELIGRKFSDFMEPGFDFDGMWAEFKRTGAVSAERKLVLPDGSVRTVECRGATNMLPGRHLFVMHDVTDEVSLREELRGQVQLLQRALLPPTPTNLPCCEVASVYIPAYVGQEIGGDFFDVFETESGSVALMIGDVSGKGIEAAALAAATRSTVHAFAYDLASPGRALSHANAILAGNQIGIRQFVTVFLAVLDPKTGELTYCSAGHPPGIICHPDGGTELLHSSNVPIGVIVGNKYEDSASSLNAGDKLVIYTDGISEARHEQELFGSERLEKVLIERRSETPDALVTSILDAVSTWAQGNLRDDTAMVIVSRS